MLSFTWFTCSLAMPLNTLYSDTKVEVACNRADCGLLVTFTSYGLPILAIEEREAIFEAYRRGFSAQVERPGTGVGLGTLVCAKTCSRLWWRPLSKAGSVNPAERTPFRICS